MSKCKIKQQNNFLNVLEMVYNLKQIFHQNDEPSKTYRRLPNREARMEEPKNKTYGVALRQTTCLTCQYAANANLK